MKISKYQIAKKLTNATSHGEYYICNNTAENQAILKNLLMPSAIRGDKLIFPYFN